MTWFLDLTTRNKLFFGFGLKLALMIWVIATAYSGITRIQESEQRLYQEDFANVRDLLALRVNYNGMRVLMLEAQMLSKRAEQDPLVAQATERSKQIDRLLLGLLARAKNDPKQLSRLEELQSVWQAFAQTKDAEIIPLILEGKLVESRQLAVGVQQERAERIRAIAQELGNTTEENMRLAVARAELESQQSLRLFLLVGIAVVVIGAALVLLLERVIAGPLRELSRAAERVAASDLSVSVPTRSAACCARSAPWSRACGAPPRN